MKHLITILILLISITIESQTITYSYDACGNRISREIILSRSIDTSKKSFEEKLSENTIIIYPNPTEGILKIEIKGWEQTGNQSIIVYDSNGGLIHDTIITSSITEIDLSNCTNSIYILIISYNNETSTWKIIKK
ncbi:MAG: T9SS type A sorting domain-containing protein [Muribaculaceae bacterium]|nr:T9SS type A sorting domain-containing protein [Muribaculaceae bacterium]